MEEFSRPFGTYATPIWTQRWSDAEALGYSRLSLRDNGKRPARNLSGWTGMSALRGALLLNPGNGSWLGREGFMPRRPLWWPGSICPFSHH